VIPSKSHPFMQNSGFAIWHPYHFPFSYFYNPFTSIFPVRQQLVNPVKSKWISFFIVRRVFYCIFIAPAAKWEMQKFCTQPSLIISFNFKVIFMNFSAVRHLWRGPFTKQTDGGKIPWPRTCLQFYDSSRVSPVYIAN